MLDIVKELYPRGKKEDLLKTGVYNSNGDHLCNAHTYSTYAKLPFGKRDPDLGGTTFILISPAAKTKTMKKKWNIMLIINIITVTVDTILLTTVEVMEDTIEVIEAILRIWRMM